MAKCSFNMSLPTQHGLLKGPALTVVNTSLSRTVTYALTSQSAFTFWHGEIIGSIVVRYTVAAPHICRNKPVSNFFFASINGQRCYCCCCSSCSRHLPCCCWWLYVVAVFAVNFVSAAVSLNLYLQCCCWFRYCFRYRYCCCRLGTCFNNNDNIATTSWPQQLDYNSDQ